MKHENNFLLYSLGSAFLLVATALQLSVATDSKILAQIGSVQVFSQEEEVQQLYPVNIVHFSDVSGVVFDDSSNPVSNIEINLYESTGYPNINSIARVYTDENGAFSFTHVKEGQYEVVIVQPEDYLVISPEPKAVGIENPRYGYQIFVTEKENHPMSQFILSEKTSQ